MVKVVPDATVFSPAERGVSSLVTLSVPFCTSVGNVTV